MRHAGELIDPRLREWARQAEFKQFTKVQLESFAAILCEQSDLIIGGGTSSGKTEAAFLPLLTLAAKRKGGVSVLVIIPTKPLINDQFRRLETMAKRVGVPIWKWHGDASAARKDALLAKRNGIVFMTPESLQGRFKKPSVIRKLFANLDAIVIDELHDFLSGPRGHQVAALVARLDRYADQPIRRIGISATIGDIDYAKRWLSPANHRCVRFIDADATSSRLLSRIRGYEAPVSKNIPTGRRRLQELKQAAFDAIASVLVERHRRGTHLVFAGAKRHAEMLCSSCASLASAARLPDRFRVHHGSMGPEHRVRVEEDLRHGAPRSVFTTRTLELGIDIGQVDAIDQIGAPHSLTAFRQRIGRSGRRSDPAMVTIHVTEERQEYALSLLDRLRLNTVRAIAALNLLEQHFVEPAEPDATVLTVVLQQTLSYIHEYAGATLSDLSRFMRSVTPFARVSAQSYARLLAELCKPGLGLLHESERGKYFLTLKGEKLFESNEFYAVFQAFVAWEICSRGGDVGILPRSFPIEVGDTFRLSGRAWKAISVDTRRGRVTVEPSSSGFLPYFNVSGNEGVHEALAREMRNVLAADSIPKDCDGIAQAFLQQGRSAFREAALNDRTLVEDVEQEMCHLFTWKGTKFNSLLAVLLRFKRFACDINEVAVSVSCLNASDVIEALSQDLPTIEDLSNFVECLNVGKFDKWVPEELLREDWAKRHQHLEQDLHAFCRQLSEG